MIEIERELKVIIAIRDLTAIIKCSLLPFWVRIKKCANSFNLTAHSDSCDSNVIKFGANTSHCRPYLERTQSYGSDKTNYVLRCVLLAI